MSEDMHIRAAIETPQDQQQKQAPRLADKDTFTRKEVMLIVDLTYSALTKMVSEFKHKPKPGKNYLLPVPGRRKVLYTREAILAYLHKEWA